MTDEQRREVMRRQAESMRAMSDEQMAARAAAQEGSMRNAGPDGPDYARHQAAMTNFWRGAVDAMPIAQLPPKPRLTLWTRFKRWLRA